LGKGRRRCGPPGPLHVQEVRRRWRTLTMRRRPMITRTVTLDMTEVCNRAGFTAGPDGRINLPPEQDTCHRLAIAARELVGRWRPGDPALDVLLTGPSP